MQHTRGAQEARSAPARRLKLIVNPTAGVLGAPLDRLAEVAECLAAAQITVDVAVLGGLEAAAVLARQAVDEGYAVVAAAGGDGTVERVASGLLGTATPLGILPFGTFNNISRALAIPRDLDGALRVLTTGSSRAIDVGLVNGLAFFEAAGVGLDAALFPLGEEIKGGRWTRVGLALATLLRFRPTRLRLRLEGPEGNRAHDAVAHMVVVANGPYYGMGFTVAPRAIVDDGLLDVIIFERFTKAELLRHFATIAFGRFAYDPRVTVLRARAVAIEGEWPLAVHADGVLVGRLPVHCSVAAGVLRVLAPSTGGGA